MEASEVKGSRERPTIVIRSLFTKSNHITDYREYLDKHAAILQSMLANILSNDLVTFSPKISCNIVVQVSSTWTKPGKRLSNQWPPYQMISRRIRKQN